MSSTQDVAEGSSESHDLRKTALKTWHARGNAADPRRFRVPTSRSRQFFITNQAFSAPEHRSVLKASNKKVAQKTEFFAVNEESVARRAKQNLFKDYPSYFIGTADVDKIKETETRPGFYLYLGIDSTACALVVHAKGNNQTIYFNRIAEIDESLIKSLTAQLVAMQIQSTLERTSKPKAIRLGCLVQDLIIANCRAYLTRSPFLHNKMHPVQIYQLSNNDKVRVFLETYFFEENIQKSLLLDESAFNIETIYIVFSDLLISETYQDQLRVAKEKNLNLIQITIQDNQAPDINEIIDSLFEMCADAEKKSSITQFRKEVADRAKRIAAETIVAREAFGNRSENIAAEEEMKSSEKQGCFHSEKMILSDLINIYIIAGKDQNDPLKQRFLELVSLYYENKRDLEETVKAIKDIHRDKYSSHELRHIPAEEAVSSMILEGKAGENPKIIELKNLLAHRTEQLLSKPTTTAFKKRILSKNLIRLYEVIDAEPAIVLIDYEAYQRKIELKSISQIEKEKTLEELMKNIRQHSSHHTNGTLVPADGENKASKDVTPFWVIKPQIPKDSVETKWMSPEIYN